MITGGLFGNVIRERRCALDYDLKAGMRTFLAEITKTTDITTAHAQLKEELDEHLAATEPYDEWEEWDLVNSFIKTYTELNDTRSINVKVREYVEGRAMYAGTGTAYDAEMMAFYPAEYGKDIPARGKWIMPIMEIPVEEKFKPGLYNVYYAKPAYTPVEIQIGEKTAKIRRLKAKITVEAGEVMLLPHEYVVINNPTDILQGVGEGKEYEMVRLGGTANYDQAKVHYLGTRGVSEADVYQMLMGDLNSTTFCYFRLRPEYLEQYDYLISAMQKGIDYKMACRLWYHAKTGIPMFKLVDATGKDRPRKSGKKADPS